MKKQLIFFDVDTQNDFMNEDGALYVPDAELIKPNLKALTDYAVAKGIVIYNSVDRHFGTEEYKDQEGELSRWGGPFPDHCMDGTFGAEKIPETDCSDERGYPYFEKQSYDVFTNPLLEIFLKRTGVNKAVVYGVATDYCVKAAVLGMQMRGIQCFVVEDAIKEITLEGKLNTFKEFQEEGVKLTTTKKVLGGEYK